MANTQLRFGFKHVGTIGGSPPSFTQAHRLILSTYSTAIGFGDPVAKPNATSQYIVQHPGDGTTSVLGIFVGCNPTYAAVGYPQWFPGWSGAAAARDAVAYVIDDPNALFLAAAFNTAIVTAQVGYVANFTGGVAFSTGAMLSIATVDQASATSLPLISAGTASPLPFKIVDLYQGIGNGSDPTTAFNWVLVTFNNEIWKAPTGV